MKTGRHHHVSVMDEKFEVSAYADEREDYEAELRNAELDAQYLCDQLRDLANE